MKGKGKLGILECSRGKGGGRGAWDSLVLPGEGWRVDYEDWLLCCQLPFCMEPFPGLSPLEEPYFPLRCPPPPPRWGVAGALKHSKGVEGHRRVGRDRPGRLWGMQGVRGLGGVGPGQG